MRFGFLRQVADHGPRVALDGAGVGLLLFENDGEQCRLARAVGADKRDAVERIISDLDCDPMIADRIALRLAWQFGYDGTLCNMDRFITGEPECMMSPVLVESVQPDAVIRLVVDGTVMSSVDAEDITRRGLVVAALIDTLTKLGRGVELWWTYAVESSARKVCDNYAVAAKCKVHH